MPRQPWTCSVFASDMVALGDWKVTVQLTLLTCQLLWSHAQGLCDFNLIRVEATVQCT